MFYNKAPRGSIAQIILKALSSENKYGYEICKDIEKITNGKLLLKQPSLYSSLRRMEEQGLISSYWEDSNLGGKRHYYSLTDEGKKYLNSNINNFQTDEELIANLPKKELESPSEETSYYHNLSNDTNSSPTSVVKQENFFALSKPHTFVEKEEPTIEENKMFLQFDLFNENVSFIKEESPTTKNIQSFVNKYTEYDNHSEEIQPSSPNIQENDASENVNSAQIITKEKSSFNSTNNSLPKLNDENTIKSINSIPKETYNSNNQISWEFNNIEENNNTENDDYKTVIGQLYNNSRLEDPYEQNKYQTFKAIFPSSNFKQTQNIFSDYSVKSNIEEKNKNLIVSNEESNIDCEDFRNLNNLYNLQGIEIKIHDKKENKKVTKIYTDKNKLNMVNSWIISLIMLLEILFSNIILKGKNLIIGKQRILFFLSLAFIFSYCIISTLENLFDRYKLIVIDKNIKKSFLYKLFLFIISIIIIFTLNIIFGMNNLFQIEYFTYWFLPIILLTNLLISEFTYNLLLKFKNFSS